MSENEKPIQLPEPPVDTGTLVYLTIPYDDPNLQTEQFAIANRIAARIINDGIFVFSSISHGHSIASSGIPLPTAFAFWKRYAEVLIRRCQVMVVITTDGFDKSEGVLAEMEIAARLGIPVRFIQP